MARYVVGIAGASGTILGLRAVQALVSEKHDVELVITQAAVITAFHELDKNYQTPEELLEDFNLNTDRIHLHHNDHLAAPIASGSYPTDGMLIIPCSMGALAAIATGLADSLFRRAADVTLKERRKLVIVPRETPLHQGHLENMLKITKIGGTIVPPIPAWYTKPQTVEEIENFIVARALEVLGVRTELYQRWKGV